VRVSVIDERNELSAADEGCIQFDLGPCADVLAGLSKQESLPLLLRGMSPQVIAMDEIVTVEDAETLLTCHGSGVGLLATAHGESLELFGQRPPLRRLLDERVFAQILHITMQNGKRRYKLCDAP
jgi:stage III sporulation protein AA